MKIAIAGLGYVGLSNAMLLAAAQDGGKRNCDLKAHSRDLFGND